MVVTPSRSPRLDSLTALRLVAALMVFGFHGLGFFDGVARGVGDVLFGAGRSGVTFFFVLSGFVLAWGWTLQPVGEPAGWITFYRRRLARICPAYLVALILGAVALAAFESPAKLADGWLAPLLLQAWVPSSDYYFALVVPAWSLSCEAFFSLLLPAFAGRVLGARTRTLVGLGAAMVAVPVVLASVAVHAVSGAQLSDNSVWVWLVLYCPLARLPEFVLGVVLAALVRRGALPRVDLAAAGGLVAVVYLGCGAFPSVFGVVALPLIPFALLIVAAAQSDLRATTGALLRSRPLVALGGLSYCFYLVHHVFVARLLAANPSGLRGGLALLLAFALAAVAAWLLHVLVERPGMRWFAATSSAPPAGRSPRPACARRTG